MSLRGKTVLCLGFLFALAYADEVCDKSQCKGPTKYYEELKCKPVYTKPDDCCPARYDCSHLEGRATDKCYANGRAYSKGEDLRDEDRASPCDIGCRCVTDNPFVPRGKQPSFMCAIVDCFAVSGVRLEKGCYWKQKLGSCCGTGEIYCPKEGEEKVTCEVEGKTYYDGQSFYPEGRGLSCVCIEGFKGEFVEPFCRKVSCGTEMRKSSYFYEKCAPVYYNAESIKTGCNIEFRCQNYEDKVVKTSAVKSPVETPAEMKCSFGNITMDVGDELNQVRSTSPLCVECVCEVPPTPTCRQLSENECEALKRQKID